MFMKFQRMIIIIKRSIKNIQGTKFDGISAMGFFTKVQLDVIIFSTDSGWDNPFRPDGDLSREADEIVNLIKGL